MAGHKINIQILTIFPENKKKTFFSIPLKLIYSDMNQASGFLGMESSRKN